MGVGHALFTLKDKKSFLERKLNDIDSYKEKHGEENVERFKTRLKHDIASLEYGIEILEEYED